jgi:hypothetical protein
VPRLALGREEIPHHHWDPERVSDGTRTGGASGVRVDYALFGVIMFRDGKVARMEWFRTRHEARKAAGLAE